MSIGSSNIGSINIGSGNSVLPSAVSAISNIILRYVPKFVKRNDNFLELVFRIATALASLKAYIYSLNTIVTTGASGMRYAEINHLLLSGYEDNSTLWQAIQNMIAIHKARGTEAGVLADVKRITADTTATIEFFSGEEAGWWTESTYADLDQDGTVNLSESVVMLDNVAFLRIVAENKSKRSNNDIRNKITREIVPINIAHETILT